MKKALILYSGGLDSRLAVEILKEKGYTVEAISFKLPFGCTAKKTKSSKNLKIKNIDLTKEPLLSEYLKIIKNPKHGTGAGINPCRDCKIFMFKLAKEFADKNNIKIIATGEVIGQRPMSQTKNSMKLIDDEIGFKLTRPLIELGIRGRSRKKQLALAKKYRIKYPSPGGGCALCEKQVANRIKTLIEKKLITEKTLPLSKIGRHFIISNVWFVVARNETESNIISKFKTIIPDAKGKPSVYYSKAKGKENAIKLQEAYSTGEEKMREDFKEYKL